MRDAGILMRACSFAHGAHELADSNSSSPQYSNYSSPQQNLSQDSNFDAQGALQPRFLEQVCVCVYVCVCVRACACARPPSSVCPCTILSSLPAGVCATCRASLDSCQNARAHSNCNRARSRIRMVVCCKAVAGGAGWLEALTVEVAAVFMNRIPVCRRAWATNPTRSLVLALSETRHRACMGSTAGVDFPLEAIQVTAFSQGQGRAASLSSHLAHFA